MKQISRESQQDKAAATVGWSEHDENNETQKIEKPKSYSIKTTFYVDFQSHFNQSQLFTLLKVILRSQKTFQIMKMCARFAKTFSQRFALF